MHEKANQIELRPEIGSLGLSLQDGFQVAATAIGFAGELLRLWAPSDAMEAIFERTVGPNFASFPVTQASQRYTARLSITTKHRETVCELPDMSAAYPLIQLLPDDRAIVAAARCKRFLTGEVDLNARVYSLDGSIESDFCLGDGIEHLQADGRGQLWVGYCDEGVYGNFGWGNRPMGWAGLATFEGSGNHLWDFRPPGGFDAISDCYALNVSDDAAWACYYTGFPIVRVGSKLNTTGWRTNLSGPTALGVSGHMAMSYGGYQGHETDCSLLCLGDGLARELARVRLLLPEEADLGKCTVIGRGPMLHAFSDTHWYTFRVPERENGP